MNESQRLLSQITIKSVIIAIVIGGGIGYPAYSQSQTKNQQLLIPSNSNINFNPPNDDAPKRILLGSTRGQIRFNAGGSAPKRSQGGGTRGNVNFAPPGKSAPNHSKGGGTRGNVNFAPPGKSAPNNSTGGGTRGDVTFMPANESSPNHTSSGGTRDPINSGDNISDSNILIPLTPETNYGQTVSARPTFFVYVPEMSTRRVFFSLQDENYNTIYQTKLDVSGQEGIVSFTLPPEAPELEVGKNYVWFFAPLEPGGTLKPDNYGVSAWVKRVEISRDGQVNSDPIKQAIFYANSGIWYDTLNILQSAKKAQPNNITFNREWKELLEQVGLKKIADYSVVEKL
ncbi:MAG: DUF928 domain-containing protein [Okeania sp. SIO3I5]|uniref:DUF928 domain-containing protein n=1 Tax=Okeania sp. SIO3I5 TaxID=2607805 RepID=UPI0013BDAB0A|nr:DUF928 domain-containing protein [Okeania sp. SIO3I5]NEQ39584.1 DUF928 domain-containing protein [Okeania sp. SIO3I5]